MSLETPQPAQMHTPEPQPIPVGGGGDFQAPPRTSTGASEPTLLTSAAGPLLQILAPFFRLGSKASFGFALFCLFLPFFTVSCPGGEYPLTGTDLLLGVQIEGNRYGAEALSWITLTCIIAGLALTFAVGAGALKFASIFAGLGAGSLLALALKLAGSVKEETEGLAQISASAGFFLCLFSLAAAAALAWSAAEGTREKRSPRTLPSRPVKT